MESVAGKLNIYFTVISILYVFLILYNFLSDFTSLVCGSSTSTTPPFTLIKRKLVGVSREKQPSSDVISHEARRLMQPYSCFSVAQNMVHTERIRIGSDWCAFQRELSVRHTFVRYDQ